MSEGLNIKGTLSADRMSNAGRYRRLRRTMMIIMIVVTIVPLFVLAFINHYQYQRALEGEVLGPVKTILNKTKSSFELFLAERRSAVSFIASAYSYEELADGATLSRIFEVMREEFGGFIDLGLIDKTGRQVSYAGPYNLKDKHYEEQDWFHEVKVRGTYISDVFLGYRKFPHFVIAVEQGGAHRTRSNFLRATIDTEKFDTLIASMGLEADSDGFIVNREGILQTSSKYYGRVLEKLPFTMPPTSYEPSVIRMRDPAGRKMILGYSSFISPAFVIMVVKPQSVVLKSWYNLQAELLLIVIISSALIIVAIWWLTRVIIRRLEEADQKQNAIFHEMEYTNKLASIGRLAAGVAHEINNPMAIINEKAGLMKDLIESVPGFEKREKFLGLTESIIRSVDRCRTITHRLLGFARRMDVAIEVMDLNAVIKETLGFLEKEALHRNVDLRLDLQENLPQIASDRGQLQQVFLNIINNSLAAVRDGGNVRITSWEVDHEQVAVSIRDNGVGMSEETRERIFEPFFTTRKGVGTGLGLSITYGIVKKLGGDITVQSKEGEGTTFTVYLSKTAKQGME